MNGKAQLIKGTSVNVGDNRQQQKFVPVDSARMKRVG
jgi:hypothetical protein